MVKKLITKKFEQNFVVKRLNSKSFAPSYESDFVCQFTSFLILSSLKQSIHLKANRLAEHQFVNQNTSDLQFNYTDQLILAAHPRAHWSHLEAAKKGFSSLIVVYWVRFYNEHVGRGQFYRR